MVSNRPERVVCLSAESADWLARLGAWDQVVGVTAYFESPQELACKPKISGFSSASIERIQRLEPDLIIGFSDVQAELAAKLIQLGYAVLVTNQRTIDETIDTLAALARLVGRSDEAASWLDVLQRELTPVTPTNGRPRVYFEEWDDPLIVGVAWVSELIERAGGIDVFAEYRQFRSARDRTVRASDVLSAAPEIMLASWCGKPVDWEQVRGRSGWDALPCVRANQLFEIPGCDILQPGWNLIEGYRRIKQIVGG